MEKQEKGRAMKSSKKSLRKRRKKYLEKDQCRDCKLTWATLVEKDDGDGL